VDDSYQFNKMTALSSKRLAITWYGADNQPLGIEPQSKRPKKLMRFILDKGFKIAKIDPVVIDLTVETPERETVVKFGK
jgi:SOS response regulatory protein OraA/RecX